MNNIWGSTKMLSKYVSGLMLVLAFSALAYGQTSFGRISGNVTDAGGAAVPNASVTVTDPSTSFSRTVTTDDSGYYTVTNLPVGTYSVQGRNAKLQEGDSIEQRGQCRLAIDRRHNARGR
jgi:hypothetical protein